MRTTIRHTLIGAAVGLAAVAATTPANAAPTRNMLPVFTVQQVGLTADEAAKLQRAFGLERVERNGDGSVQFVNDETFLRVPTLAGEQGEGEDGPTLTTRLDFEALSRITVVRADEATVQTNRALREVGLLPANGEAHSDHTELEIATTQGRSTTTKLDTVTSYRFSLDGLPYEGPGAKVRVAYDGSGKVTQLRYATRSLVKADSVKVANDEVGQRRCALMFPEGSRVAASLAYYAPELAARSPRLEPSFKCSGTTADGASLQETYVPAKQDARMPSRKKLDVKTTRPMPGKGNRSAAISVGSEGTGVCSGLDYTGVNLQSFSNGFSNRGVQVDFSWLDGDAWEDDFKDPAFGGNDTTWTDNVDLAYWQGHGSPNSFSFSGCSEIDDTSMHRNDARWGNNDVEWMSLFTCLILKGVDGELAWWQRWGPAFHRLHQINSFDTVSKHSSKHGGIYAKYLLEQNKKVRTAWALASIDDQPEDVKWANMGPVRADGMVNIDDHFHGHGSVGPDVSASDVTAWWYLRGPS